MTCPLVRTVSARTTTQPWAQPHLTCRGDVVYRTLIGRHRAAEAVAPYVATAVGAIQAGRRTVTEGRSR